MAKINILEELVALQKREIESLIEKNEELRKEIKALQNKAIRERPSGKRTSKYKGVSFDKTHNVWRVQMYISGKVRALGTFPPTRQGEIDAANKYLEVKEKKDAFVEKYTKLDNDKKTVESDIERRKITNWYMEATRPKSDPKASSLF